MVTRAEAERKAAEGRLQAQAPIRRVMRDFRLSEGADYALLEAANPSHYSVLVVRERSIVTPSLLAQLAKRLASQQWGVVVLAAANLSREGELLFEVSGGGITLICSDAWASRMCREAWAQLGFSPFGDQRAEE